MPSEQKDWWDKVDIIAKTVTALLVPFISIVAVYLVNSNNEVDWQQLQTQRQKEISGLLVKLSEQKDPEVRAQFAFALSTYGADAIDPLKGILLHQLRLASAKPQEQPNVKLIAEALALINDTKTINTLIDIVDDQDIGVTHKSNPFDNSIQDPVASALDSAVERLPDSGIPKLVQMLCSKSLVKQVKIDTYSVILGNRYSTRYDTSVLTALLSAAYEPKGGEGGKPAWNTDTVYAIGKILYGQRSNATMWQQYQDEHKHIKKKLEEWILLNPPDEFRKAVSFAFDQMKKSDE